MNEFVDELSNAKGYNDELRKALYKIVPAMIEYYGYEDIIKEALASSFIYECNENENIYDVEQKYSKYTSKGNGVVKESDVKRGSGICFTEPEIIKTDNGYELGKTTRIVAISNHTNLNTDTGMITLIHELSHLVKSYKNDTLIEGNILYTRSGFIDTYEKILEDEEGNIIKELISDKNVGFEEGINAYDETKIYSIVSREDTKFSSYAIEATLINNLYSNNPNIQKDVIEAQLTGDTTSFKTKYNMNSDKDLFDELTTEFDNSVKLTYESIAKMFLYSSTKEEDRKQAEEIKQNRIACARRINSNIVEHINNVSDKSIEK